ncbi:coiled-coil domain-containing protein 16 [Culex quinquefasciatus]|uniref:Zinc finger protein 830 n=1 Tax=Culex quinquefasciatus TaxID=7176 RepID=B0WL11_CULQU|nr:zinc finger protein 830 [Culex quinquefasciatus]EDS30174.1 coiled-coil domain-containing protein 16 [Culex quinquefasciatus]|eukprot:XP_001849395.1 coiled-coil domain-containing protein 16 [Culex quinquefasciatus]
MLAKKKYTQQDLRRLMNETKAGSAKQQPEGAGTTSAKKIDSPLAKYTESGQLTCALCRSVVRSEAVWKVHINSKQHKENIEQAKKLKEQVKAQPAVKSDPPPAPAASFKRPSSPGPRDVPGAGKKIKGILKNSSASPAAKDDGGSLPADFFDAGVKIKRDLVNIRLPSGAGVSASKEDKEQPAEDAAAPPPEDEEEKLPEGFFDDPKADAKARNIEYKDPNDEEWERFQRVIKDATTESLAIINEEQEESTAERQISEIDEQIRNWSRVLSLERKKDEVRQRTASAMAAGERRLIEGGGGAAVKTEIKKEDSDDEDGDEDGEFEEFPDWRAKKSFK